MAEDEERSLRQATALNTKIGTTWRPRMAYIDTLHHPEISILAKIIIIS